jgi:hypothetical protein
VTTTTDAYRWVTTALSRSDLYLVLRHGLAVPAAELEALQVSEAELTQKVDKELQALLERFRQAAALPEQRLALAESYGFSYDDLTNWVIRADLLRVDGVDPSAAAALAFAGALGVHDLAPWREWEQVVSGSPQVIRRVQALESQFQENLARLEDAPRARSIQETWKNLDLQALVESAHALARVEAPQIVTATEVILVVKGAGLQAPDQTLDQFLNGFWPAVKTIEERAAITQRYDVLPLDFPSPYRKDRRPAVAEIHAGERRIWIREAHWETALRAPEAVKAVFLEWKMATYTFGSHLYGFIRYQRTRLNRFRKHRRMTLADLRRRDFWEYYLAFFLQHLYIFLFLGWVHWDQGRVNIPVLNRVIQDNAQATLIGIAAAIMLALSPALQTLRITKARPLQRLPSLSKFMLLVMMVSFLGNPLRYLLGLALLYLIQTTVLIARDLAWPYREKADSDTNLSQYDIEVDDEGREQVVRRHKRRAKLFLAPILYRYLVVLVLPITLIALGVARLLKMTIILRPLGNVIDDMLQNSLSGVLGDVVAYAMDPAQANRVRSVVEANLKFFHHRPDVDKIHVFAHSQGTPITFETLFHYLPALYRRKIKSYVTIGSVLSYYHQANPVLDSIHIRRFPVRSYPQFSGGFRWYNFWNSYDPITEYSALDEYELYEVKRVSSQEEGTLSRLEPSASNPVNVKTSGTWLPWAGHTEYWSNLPEIQIPFAYRVLGDTERPEWIPETPRKAPMGLSYFTCLISIEIPILLAMVGVAFATWVQSRQIAQWLLHRGTIGRIAAALPRDGWLGDIVTQIGAVTVASAIPDTIWLVLIVLALIIINWFRPKLALLARIMASTPERVASDQAAVSSSPVRTGD